MVVAAYRIEINGKDMTDTWRRERRLLSIEVRDKLGASSDSCTLELDDRPPHVAWPPAGARLRLWLGATERDLRDLGTYTLDVPEASGPPHRLVVTGHAATFVAGDSIPMHSHRSRLWQSTSLADMAETIAIEHGLNVKVARALEGASVGPLEQVDETDLAFLSRVTERVGARVRVRAGQLEVFAEGALTTTEVPLGPADIESWFAPLGERFKPGKVTARWHSAVTGQAGEISDGTGEPALVLGELYDSADAARNAAAAARNDTESGTARLAITLAGLRTDIGAGTTCRVNSLRSAVDGPWVATEVVHHTDGHAGRTAISTEQTRRREAPVVRSPNREPSLV